MLEVENNHILHQSNEILHIFVELFISCHLFSLSFIAHTPINKYTGNVSYFLKSLYCKIRLKTSFIVSTLLSFPVSQQIWRLLLSAICPHLAVEFLLELLRAKRRF